MKNIIQLILLLFLISCNSSLNSGDKYYFPLKNFFTEKTYCFINQNDTTEKSYWKMRTMVLENDTILQTTIYNNQNRILDEMKEKISNGISKIDTYTLYDYDEQGNKFIEESKIIDSFVFKENQNINEPIQWKISFKNGITSNICQLSKTRTLQSINNNERIFNDLMIFTDKVTSESFKYTVKTVYQKDKGLISYKMILPNGKVKDFILTSIK